MTRLLLVFSLVIAAVVAGFMFLNLGGLIAAYFVWAWPHSDTIVGCLLYLVGIPATALMAVGWIAIGLKFIVDAFAEGFAQTYNKDTAWNGVKK